jgi:hypothetical protein
MSCKIASPTSSIIRLLARSAVDQVVSPTGSNPTKAAVTTTTPRANPMCDFGIYNYNASVEVKQRPVFNLAPTGEM